METTVEMEKSGRVRILLVGNNPIDMSRIMEKLNEIRGTQIITEIAFDVKSIVQRLMNFHPNYILIDDNIGKTELTETVNALNQSRKTKDIPITVLKNSNYQESYGSLSILDYILKANLSAEALYRSIRNCLKFRRAQFNLYRAYSKRRKPLLKLAS